MGNVRMLIRLVLMDDGPDWIFHVAILAQRDDGGFFAKRST